MNKTFKDWTIKNGCVLITLASSSSKAFLAEKYIRLLKRKIGILQNHYKTNNIPKFLSMALDSHNSTTTLRFKGYSPNDLLNRNPEALRMRNEQIMVRATHAERTKFRKKVEALEDLGLGTYVRISRLGRQFQKEASRKSYSLEIFRIIKLRPPTLEDAPCTTYYYFIKDMQGEEIRGAFKRNELMKVSPQPDASGFKFTITEWSRKKNDRQKYIIKLGGKYSYAELTWIRSSSSSLNGVPRLP